MKTNKKQYKEKENFSETKRISIYIYEAQLKKVDEICQKRQKTKRSVFLEAIQTYISLYEEGKL
jgi:metal-responsive CopG/Arc/MetJ family transcriptional regulator